MKRILLSLSLGAVVAALFAPCYAAAPAKIAAVAPIADVTAEADAKLKILDEFLASDKTYLEGKGSTIPTAAGVLAILAQAVVESEENAAWKASAADVRDGAIAIATSKSYDDAKKGLAAVKDAIGGKASGAKADHEWNTLCKLGGVMKEVSARNGKLRRGARLKELKDDEAEGFSRDASVAAVLALAVHDDTHEVKSKKQEDIDQWKKFAKAYQEQMTAASAAFKKKDLTAAADAFKKGNTLCNDCHSKFKEGE
jgi:hypothetical protein